MDDLIPMMVGRKIENVYNREYNEPGEEALRTEDLEGYRFRHVNINVRNGEIVGFAGLVGAGRTELVKALFGYDPILSGKVYLNGKEMKTYVLSGAAELVVDDVTYIVKAGYMYHLPCNSWHTWKAIGNERFTYLDFFVPRRLDLVNGQFNFEKWTSKY